MKKKYIILISILASVLAILLILFGFVFVLRRQSVTFMDKVNEVLEISESDIIETAGLKNGRSIFSLNKDKATEKLEKAYPEIKVVQIKTVSAIRVEFKIRLRHKMFYAEKDGFYYILDEELKVLDVSKAPQDLPLIDIAKLGITANTEAGDFVGQAYSQTIYNLFTCICKTAKFDDPSTEEVDYKFLSIEETREQIKSLFYKIEFKEGVTADGSYNRLVITTSTSNGYGVKMDIGKPEENLEYKVNVCFATLNELSETEKKTGTIKFTYLFDGTEQKGYSDK